MKYNLYRNYVGTISQEFSTLLSSIEAEFGFDFGREFEQILAEALRKVLPQKFGICLGFVMNSEGIVKGDDLIIFDIERFPTLKMRKQGCYARKEYIPVEAVYAYIEVKHTLILEGESANSLNKAINQVAEVKSLCAGREPRPLHSIDTHIDIGKNLQLDPTPNWPDIWNPPYGAIIARQVRFKKNGNIIEDPFEISSKLRELSEANKLSTPSNKPDLIVCSQDNVLIPTIPKSIGGVQQFLYESPFLLDNKSVLTPCEAKDEAFGVGMCSLLHALDWIKLGKMKWKQILADGISKS